MSVISTTPSSINSSEQKPPRARVNRYAYLGLDESGETVSVDEADESIASESEDRKSDSSNTVEENQESVPIIRAPPAYKQPPRSATQSWSTVKKYTPPSQRLASTGSGSKPANDMDSGRHRGDTQGLFSPASPTSPSRFRGGFSGSSTYTKPSSPTFPFNSASSSSNVYRPPPRRSWNTNEKQITRSSSVEAFAEVEADAAKSMNKTISSCKQYQCQDHKLFFELNLYLPQN